jgi:cholesterol transport system auxiliary component
MVSRRIRNRSIRPVFGDAANGRKGPGSRATLILILAPLALVACGAPEPVQRDRFFSLEPPIQAPPGQITPLRATLLVNDLAARGFLGGRQILYRTQDRPLEVQRYNLLLWEKPPGRAIAGDLTRALRTAGLFELVITPAQRSRTDYILGGEVDRFEHLPTARPPEVMAEFSLTLMRGVDRRSLFSRRYRGREQTRAETPEAMAQAFNRLAGRLIGQAVQDLRALRPRLRPASGR